MLFLGLLRFTHRLESNLHEALGNFFKTQRDLDFIFS